MTARSVKTTTASSLTQTTRPATLTRLISAQASSVMSSSQAVLVNPSVEVHTQATEGTNTHKTAMPVPTESPNPTNTSHGNTNTELYIGVIVLLAVLLLIVASTSVVTVACISVKKKKTTLCK